MIKFQLVITQANGAAYWSEGFETMRELNKWLSVEQSRPYWKKELKVEIIDNSAEVERLEKERLERIEKEMADGAKAREELLKLRETPPKTVKECADAIALILDHLGIKSPSVERQ